MTLSTQNIKTVYVPNGAQTLYAVPFPIFSASDLKCVYVDAASKETAITAFTVEGFGTTGGVYVRFSSAPKAGGSLVIRRNTRQVQETAYPEGGKFPSPVVERDFDRIVGMIQELQEASDRSIKINSASSNPKPAEEFYTDMQAFANAAASSASKAAGSATQAGSSATTATSKATAASASATQAAGSAASAAGSASNAASSEARAAASESRAAASENMARKWAENPMETAVIAGHYSAYHWAMRAAASATALASIYGDTMNRVRVLEDLGASLRGMVNNLQSLVVGCCENLEDYRFVHEAVTEHDDDGLLTEAITAYADWGALTL